MKTKEEIKAVYGTESYYAYKEGYEEGYIESINSLRNQAAIAAMQGLLANSGVYLKEGDTFPNLAVRYADALIEELKKK